MGAGLDIGPIFDIVSWVLIVAGAFFAITGAIGMLRLPDVFSRMHGAGMVDTLGIALILAGLAFQADEWIVVVKLGLIVFLVLLTSPTTTFALARAAIDGGVDPGPHDKLDDDAEQIELTPNTPKDGATDQKDGEP